MNKLMIVGNLTKDPAFRVTQNGHSVCDFTVAVNGRKQQNVQETSFFRVTAWDRLAETCQQYLAKGRKVLVMGPVAARPWQSEQDGSLHADLTVTAYEVEFLSSRAEAGEAVPPAQTPPPPAYAPPKSQQTQQTYLRDPAFTQDADGFTEVEVDELPF